MFATFTTTDLKFKVLLHICYVSSKKRLNRLDPAWNFAVWKIMSIPHLCWFISLKLESSLFIRSCWRTPHRDRRGSCGVQSVVSGGQSAVTGAWTSACDARRWTVVGGKVHLCDFRGRVQQTGGRKGDAWVYRHICSLHFDVFLQFLPVSVFLWAVVSQNKTQSTGSTSFSSQLFLPLC